MAIEKYYTLEMVEELTGIATRTLRAKIKENKLRARKLFGSWRIAESDLKAFILMN